MTRIVIDCDNSNVSLYLRNAAANILNASRVGCNVPDNFVYATKLNSCLNDIKIANRNINSLNEWYHNSLKEYNLLEDDMSKKCSKIETVKVTKKVQLIK